MIDAAIVSLLFLVGRPPSYFVIARWRPRQPGAPQCLVVDELPKLFLARSHKRAAPKAADDLLQHSSVRFRVDEPVGAQDQSAWRTLKGMRFRLDAARPRCRFVIKQNPTRRTP